ncbi:GT4 family glycosyltransferase PelF [Clostridium tyrobutyricum]|uniref:GT4 family glycosyltransferase PelF n=1 Tax=Clostridium tyrobutyricum TaxID=1519 RepID=UPI0010AA4EF2|nr:GT4 family glycosyltransferase PelF [Clostridium tyrobutyricum]QCH26559.1 Alpha-D-kanosaminyltransferase [Clostridium tyrobutyricum]
MKICLICEGSYPYITGGVSSWVHMLIKQMPEHEFVLYCIGAEEKNREKFNYKLHKNVIGVNEIFLDNILKEQGILTNRYNINDIQKNNIKNLITGKNVDFHELYDFLRSKYIKNVSDFFTSKDFFNIVLDSYKEKYSNLPFTEFFWAVRAMLLPLFYIINNDIPEADLYHSVSTGYAGVVGSLANAIYGKPFIITEHGIYTREREEEIIKSKWVKSYLKDMWIEFFYTLSKCSYKSAAKIITLFNKNKQIEVELGCPKDKIDIIQNGIDIKEFSNIKHDAKKHDGINIASVLRVVPIKDVKTMIQSFLIVSYEIENCNFYIIGPTDEDEEYYEECLKLVDELKIKNVFFTGRVNVKDYMDRIDIMVLSSISEGQPLAILEGMACKKPFVTTNVGSCSELLYGVNDDYGSAGIVVPLMNYVKMGHALIKLCKDKELRKQMGENGFRRVSKEYTLEKLIYSYKNIYKKYGVMK